MINDAFLDKMVLGDESSNHFGGLEFKKNPAYKNVNASSTCTIHVEGMDSGKTILPLNNTHIVPKQNGFVMNIFDKIKKTFWF